MHKDPYLALFLKMNIIKIQQLLRLDGYSQNFQYLIKPDLISYSALSLCAAHSDLLDYRAINISHRSSALRNLILHSFIVSFFYDKIFDNFFNCIGLFIVSHGV